MSLSWDRHWPVQRFLSFCFPAPYPSGLWLGLRACSPGRPPALQTASHGDVNMTSCPAQAAGPGAAEAGSPAAAATSRATKDPCVAWGPGGSDTSHGSAFDSVSLAGSQEVGLPPKPSSVPWGDTGSEHTGLAQGRASGDASSPAVCQPPPPHNSIHPWERSSFGPSDQGCRLQAVLTARAQCLPVDHALGFTRFPEVGMRPPPQGAYREH